MCVCRCCHCRRPRCLLVTLAELTRAAAYIPHGLVDDGARVGQLSNVLVGDSAASFPRERIDLCQQLCLDFWMPRQRRDGKRQGRGCRLIACVGQGIFSSGELGHTSDWRLGVPSQGRDRTCQRRGRRLVAWKCCSELSLYVIIVNVCRASGCRARAAITNVKRRGRRLATCTKSDDNGVAGSVSQLTTASVCRPMAAIANVSAVDVVS